MLSDLIKQFGTQVDTFFYLLAVINGLLHLIFAGAVARDAGNFCRTGQKTVLVSGPSWAFAALIGGVFTAAIYWILHHSTLTRPTVKEIRYDQA